MYSRVCLGVHIQTGRVHGRTTRTNSEMAAWTEKVSTRTLRGDDDAQPASDWELFTSNREHGPAAQNSEPWCAILQMRLCDTVRDAVSIRHGLPFRKRNPYHRVEPSDTHAHALVHVRRRTKKCAREAAPATVSQRVLPRAREEGQMG
jgi:hypothetical protein